MVGEPSNVCQMYMYAGQRPLYPGYKCIWKYAGIGMRSCRSCMYLLVVYYSSILLLSLLLL